jgi:hypothetical protein
MDRITVPQDLQLLCKFTRFMKYLFCIHSISVWRFFLSSLEVLREFFGNSRRNTLEIPKDSRRTFVTFWKSYGINVEFMRNISPWNKNHKGKPLAEWSHIQGFKRIKIRLSSV